MPTPKNAPYKKAQRKAEKAYRNRGRVIWVSCQVVEAPDPRLSKEDIKEMKDVPTVLLKQKVQGTMKKNHILPKGKANVKAHKKTTHRKQHYLMERWKNKYIDPAIKEMADLEALDQAEIAAAV